MKKKIMILGAGIYQVPLIRRAKELGHYVIAVSREGDYPGFRYADEVLKIDTTDREAVLRAAREYRIDGILTAGTDVAVKTIGYVCEKMNLCGIPLSAAGILTDKALMKMAFAGIVSTSLFRIAKSCAEAAEAAEEIGYPVMVKACDVSGSRGIVKAECPDQLPEAWTAAEDATHTDHIVIEKFEEGSEIGVDAFVRDGKVILYAPHGKLNVKRKGITVPGGHMFPLAVSESVSENIRHELDAIIAATGLDNCAVNCDMIIRPDGSVSVIEAGGRSGATCIPELIRIYTGVDYYRLMIATALGESMEIPKEREYPGTPCAAGLIFSDTSGAIKSIDENGIEKIRKQAHELVLDVKVGDRVSVMRNGTDRIGHIILAGTSDPDKIKSLCDTARQSIIIHPISGGRDGKQMTEDKELKKKIMLLGGNYFQMTATLAAKAAGYHVISVDYMPDNPAHAYADEYYNISTTDKEAVLQKARELMIDGIVSYASDVSAPTAAYVAEAMGLPTNPYRSVEILTHKNLFRDFLEENGFPVPEHKSFTDREAAREYVKNAGYPVMLKPVDSSGSKGIAKLMPYSSCESGKNAGEEASGDDAGQRGSGEQYPGEFDDSFDRAWDEAVHRSLSGTVIAERFIPRKGYQTDGDIFFIDGRIAFRGFCDQHMDPQAAPYVPTGSSFPTTREEKYCRRAEEEMQRVADLLGIRFGGFNVEYIVGSDDEVYLLEMGPRNGGNLIPDLIREACGVDMAEATVRFAVGDSLEIPRDPEIQRCTASYILHSNREGVFENLILDPETEKRVLRKKLLVERGERISCFHNASCGIGVLLLAYDDPGEMCRDLDHFERHVNVEVITK